MKYLPAILMLNYVATLILGLLSRDLLQDPVQPQAFFEMRILLPMILVMPFIETVFIQTILIEGALKVCRGARWALHCGAALAGLAFFTMHYIMNGPFNGYAYGLTGGVALSVMYVLNRQYGAQRAFFWTWMLHLCSNVLLVLSMAFYGMAMGVT